MSLTTGTPTLTDLENLQLGILRVSNATDAQANLTLITAGTETVAQYANALMVQANPSSQVVAGIVATMDGVTPTSAALTASTAAMATYVNYAATHPVIPIVYEAEAFGLAYGEASATFAANFGPSNAALPNTVAGDNAFAIAAVNAIFGAAATTNLSNQMIQWVHNWTAFYTANPAASGFGSAATAAQIDLAARAAAFGDGLGVAIDPVGIIQSQVINFLNQAAEVLTGDTPLTPAQIYGVAIGSIAQAAAFTGGTTVTGQTFVLTTDLDVIPGLIGSKGTTDTSGNDLIIAQDISGSPYTMNPADQINAGGGTNEFQLFADGSSGAVAQAQFPILNNVQNLWINHFGEHTLDITTSQFPNLSAVQLDDVNGTGAAVTANLIVSHDAVTFSNDPGPGAGNTYKLSSVADTSENVTLNKVGTWTNHALLDTAFPNGSATSATIAGLTIQSTGGPNFVDYWGSTDNITTVTFAHNAATGDTAFTGYNNMFGNNFAVTTDASAFTGQLILGTPGGATAANPFGTANTAATDWGDSGSNLTAATGDTVLLGSGASFFAAFEVTNGGFGDNFTLLSGHTAVDQLDFTNTNAFAAPYTTATNLTHAMALVTNFNLVGTTFASGDILKFGIFGIPDTIGTAADITSGGHTYTDVAGHAGFVAGTNLTTFLADVQGSAGYTPGDVIGYVFGGNTYVVSFDAGAAAAGHEQVVELVGVHTATGLATTSFATGQIHIA
jgi:hypothetical protein